MQELKVLYNNEKFDIVDINSIIGLKTKTMSVAILPYTIDENGLIVNVGILKEYNPFRPNNYAFTLITGTIESKDEDILKTAIRELSEEGGITCSPDEMGRWVYLGNFYTSKNSDQIIPTLAVNVTNLKINKPIGDGSEKEKLSSFIMIPANEIVASDELLPLGAFLRLFNYFYTETLQNLKEPQV